MSLIELPRPTADGPLPPEVRRLLRAADRRIEQFRFDPRLCGFVPSDYAGAYRMLQGLWDSGVARGERFCEWGSGFGVVACLAAAVGFESCGIEIEGDLVAEARRLADDFDLPVEFVQGSFVPRGAESRVCSAGEYSWLTTDGDYAYEELGLEPADLDVVFAYPWPDEEAITAQLFDRYAGPGAVLVTFHGGDDFRVRRKARRKASR